MICPPGYWPLEKSQPIIDKTQMIRLEPDRSHLTNGERKGVEKLLEVGKIFQSLYEDQRHSQALSSYGELLQLDKGMDSSAATQNLLTLYRLNQGPIATTLDNKREPFLPADGVKPGKDVYPWGVKKDEIEAFLAAHPEQRDSFMDLRTRVRLAILKGLHEDYSRLRVYPALDTLHPGPREHLETLQGEKQRHQFRTTLPPSQWGFYAIPYAVAYAEKIDAGV